MSGLLRGTKRSSICACCAAALLLPTAVALAQDSETATTAHDDGAAPTAASPIASPATGIVAKPGECYARVVIPPTFETHVEHRLKVAATERIEIAPEKFETAEEQVLVKPEGEKIVEIVPAQYRTVTEQVLIKPAGEKLTEVPATYRVVRDQELVRPAHTEWKPGHGLVEKIDNASGEVLCLVEVPAEYRTVEHREVETPATTQRSLIPAEYTTVIHQELVKAAEVRKIVVPAEYKTVKVQKLVSPAQENRVEVPAEYQDVAIETKIADGRAEWRSVLCEVNATPATIRALQFALAGKGYDPGPRDGRLDPATIDAVHHFQKARGLPQGAVTIETLDALGVPLKPGR